jgi:hypothetical protein
MLLQDVAKIEGSTKEVEESSNLIPQLEEEIPKLQEQFNQEEKVLEQIKESSRGDIFSLTFACFSPIYQTVLFDSLFCNYRGN